MEPQRRRRTGHVPIVAQTVQPAQTTRPAPCPPTTATRSGRRLERQWSPADRQSQDTEQHGISDSWPTSFVPLRVHRNRVFRPMTKKKSGLRGPPSFFRIFVVAKTPLTFPACQPLGPFTTSN